MVQLPEILSAQQVVVDKGTPNGVTDEQSLMAVPPPPPGFSIKVQTISRECLLVKGLPKIRLSIVLQSTSYTTSSSRCFRFWYKRTTATTWQSTVICNAAQNLYTLNLANGSYQVKVGPDNVTSAVSVLNSITYPVADCLLEIE